MKYFKYIGYLSLSVLLWQCEPAVDEFTPSAGNADFSKYVAIGDSYSAGYTDGALGLRGQEASFVNIMAQQFKYVGMEGEFKQPLIPDSMSVGTTQLAPGVLNGYYYLSTSSGSLAPMPGVGNAELLNDQANWINSDGPYNNMGVPGAKSYHLVAAGYGNPAAGAGNFNPFYSRFASNYQSSSVLADAALQTPTFFSLWIGGNDVLTYALAGGESDAITDINTFNFCLNKVITTMKATATGGVIGNVPDINSLPYFTTIPYNALVLTADQATALNTAYAAYNAGADMAGLPRIVFNAGSNALVIADPDYPVAGRRQIKPGEKVLLSASTNIKTLGWGSQVPIPATYTLDESEISAIQTATVQYNQSILNMAITNSLAFVDVSGFMNELKEGKVVDGNKYTTTFVSGGVFSLDGIHATARGSAMLANRFINAINQKYNASVPLANINEYDTVTFP